MRIVHLATYVNGGAGTSAYRIHEALLSQGVESYFLSLDFKDHGPAKMTFQIQDAQRSPLRLLWIKALKASSLVLGKTLSRRYFLEYRLNKRKAKLKFDVLSLPYSDVDLNNHPLLNTADIVHLHWVSRMIDYPTFFQRIEKPILWTFHDLNPIRGVFHYDGDQSRNQDQLAEIDHQVQIIKSKFIDKFQKELTVVCPSNWLLDQVRYSTLFQKRKLFVIPYPINFDTFRPTEQSELKQSLGIPSDHAVLLYVSQTVNHFRKGFDLLVQALSIIRGLPLTLLIAGHASHCDLGDLNCVYLGEVKSEAKLSQYYSVSDAVIVPSREDNLPNVMLEALACGTPVIGFSIGGLKEVIINEVNGMLTDSVDGKSLAAMIDYFLRNRHLFNRQLIAKQAFASFAPTKIASQYIEAYHSLLATRN